MTALARAAATGPLVTAARLRTPPARHTLTSGPATALKAGKELYPQVHGDTFPVSDRYGDPKSDPASASLLSDLRFILPFRLTFFYFILN